MPDEDPIATNCTPAIGVLGPLRVLHGGDEILLGAPLQRAALAVLALHAGRAVASETLIDWLWDERPPRNPSKALQTQLFRLRQALPEGWIATDGRGYRLVLDPDTVDARRFEAAARVGAAALAAGDQAGAARHLAGALAEWRGLPLADVDSIHGRAAATALDELRRAAEEDLAEARLDRPGRGGLVTDLERAVAAEPMRERRWQLLVRALAADGQQAAALRACQRAREALADGAGLDPGPSLRRLEHDLLQQDERLLAPSSSRFAALRGVRVPVPLGSLVGRAVELDAVRSALTANRLVTLVGPGGAGKTRLAIEVGTSLTAPAWFADLSSLVISTPLESAIAVATGVREEPGRTVRESLVDQLAHRDGWLVVDNCEHVLASAAEAVRSILEWAPGVSVLCTSREPLGIPGETVVLVGPLREDDAMALFAERATAAGSTTAMSGEELARICARLDWLPLALEIGAALVPGVGVRALLDRLDGSGDLEGGPGLPGRHRSLTAAVGWSAALLAPAERTVFHRLGVFAGSFDASAAQAVAGDEFSLSEPGAMALLLGRLARRSLVVATADAGGTRYHLLASVQAFARRELAAAGELVAVRDRHLAWVIDVVAEAGPQLTGPEQLRTLDRLDAMVDEIGSAFDWAGHDAERAGRAVGAAAGLFHYWMARGRRSEGTRWCSELAAAATDLPRLARVQALFGAGMLRAVSEFAVDGRLPELARTLAGSDPQALAVARLLRGTIAALGGDAAGAEDDLDAAEALLGEETTLVPPPFDRFGRLVQRTIQADLAGAEALSRRIIERQRALGDEHLASAFETTLADLLLATGRREEGVERATGALRASRLIGCRSCLTQATACVAVAGCYDRDDDGGLATLRDAVATGASIGDVTATLRAVEAALLPLAHHDPGAVARIGGAVAAIRERTGMQWVLPARRTRRDAGHALSERVLGAEMYSAAWDAGRGDSFQDIVRLVLDDTATRPGRDRDPSPSVA